MLEVACDLELPSGGSNWHSLRDGALPHEFTRGRATELSAPHSHGLSLSLSIDLSPQLTQLLSLMMHPQPDLRPSAADLLKHKNVCAFMWRGYCWKTTHRLVSLSPRGPVAVCHVSHLCLRALLFTGWCSLCTVLYCCCCLYCATGGEGRERHTHHHHHHQLAPVLPLLPSSELQMIHSQV